VTSIRAFGLGGFPEVRPGDDLAALILDAMADRPLDGGQVVAIAHTVVSKAEGALVALADVRAGERARELASSDPDRDARAIQVVLDESAEPTRA
jgi:coenzyme F420-0:L-glutamate ligase/coenzyme F420-1:gamma-L-glutamate ligase